METALSSENTSIFSLNFEAMLVVLYNHNFFFHKIV